jgi:NAD-dependent SIR2 family protein deacetylase
MMCGCFHCLRTFEATAVIDWIDDGETPLCPYCGMDSVMLEVTDLTTLWRMRARRFGMEGLAALGEGPFSVAGPLDNEN